MNEKEKEAIEIINKITEDCEYICMQRNEDTELYSDKPVPYIENRILLNLIEKQQKEIKRLKIKNNDLLRKLRNRIKDVKKLQKYGEYKKEFSTLNKRIEKQDKMIEYMAKMLVEDHEYFFSKFDDYTAEDFIKYFEKKAEQK